MARQIGLVPGGFSTSRFSGHFLQRRLLRATSYLVVRRSGFSRINKLDSRVSKTLKNILFHIPYATQTDMDITMSYLKKCCQVIYDFFHNSLLMNEYRLRFPVTCNLSFSQNVQNLTKKQKSLLFLEI